MLNGKKEKAVSTQCEISLRIPGIAPASETATLVRDVEAAGFDGAGILDSQMLCRDVFVTMALAATQTSRLTLFPAVTNPLTRHASVLASAMQTVEELAPERIKCIIGTGYTSASTIGERPATLAQMRHAIVTIQKLLARQSVDFHGTAGRLSYAAGRRIPVLMAASGPKAVELAGEVADGVLLLVGYTPGIVQAVLERLERGAKRRGRRLDDLEIIWAVRTGTAQTTEEARRQARPIAVHWGIMRWGAHWLQDADLPIPTFTIPPAVHNIYPDLSHAAHWEEAIAATAFVPDEVIAQLCDALGLIGTPDYCAQRLIEMARVGVTKLYIMPFQTFAPPRQELAAFREVILPRVRQAALT
ncbi:MAG: LLM class flavin-dependent oxidoreductase [Candidatus Tectomicrobia bacterium]|uniref:LLM class flavin-dependent oxidoreductase n=1 Tax=Tectimicrobiota bacterium TaxID=2528274 RepID=A0A937W660_UNCTE|nr:LLM class flavin-dependent oxidoreductase [Candidatus Tectomicrobia bacterium]